MFGGRVADEWGTVFPLIARDYALGLREENRRRVERGDPPQPLDEMLDTALAKTAAGRRSRRPTGRTSTCIGAQLNLYWAEFQIPVWRMALRGWKLWDALGNALVARRGARGLRPRHPRYPPGARLPDDQRPGRRRHPAGAARRHLPRVRLDRALLRHARTPPSPRSRTARTSRPAPSAGPRCASSGTRSAPSSPATTPASRPSSPSLMQAYLGRTLVALAPGLHRAGRPGRRAGRRHLRGRLPRLQPRHLRPRPPDLRRDLCRLQAAAPRQPGAATRGRRRSAREGDRLMARRRLAPLPRPSLAATFRARNIRARSTPRAPAPIARVAAEAAGTAALQELADTLARARETGRMVLDLAARRHRPRPPRPATGCRPRTPRWPPCASRSAPTASARRSRSRRWRRAHRATPCPTA